MLHSCHNRLCINPEHLRWGTRSENTIDMYAARRSPNQRFSKEDVVLIKARLRSGERPASIARSLGCPPPTIYAIAQGKNWSWVE